MLATVQNSLDVAWKELQVALKDRGLLAVIFLLPLLFGALFSLSQQGALDEATGVTAITVDVYVVNEDRGDFGDTVVDVLEGMSMLDILQLNSIQEADDLVGKGERAAAIVIPSDFSANIEAYEQSIVQVVVDPVQQQAGTIVAGLANFAVAPVSIQGELLHGIRTYVDQTGLLDEAPPEMHQAVEAQILGSIMTQLQSLETDPPIAITSEDINQEEELEPINVFDLMMPAFTVMFAFFLVGVVGITFHTERDEGTFRRLLASPMSKTALVGGPMLGYMLVIVLQVIFLFAVGAGLFNLEIGNSPLGLLVVTLALGLVVSSMGLLLGTITTTSKQADTIGTLLGFVLPFISGIFITNSLTPGYMQEGFVATIAPFIPHMHAAEGFRLVMSGEGTAEQVLAQVGYLLLFAAIFFVMARWRLKFE